MIFPFDASVGYNNLLLMVKITPYTDKELLALAHKDSEAGWELVFSRYDPMIQSITRWRKWNFSDQEKQDVCQNIYMQLQSALPTFRQESSLAWFIKRIAIRQCINEVRRQVRWRTNIIPSFQKTPDGDWNEMEFKNPDALDPGGELIQVERQQALDAVLGTLKDTCKKSINLFYVQDFSYREIAELLDISINTVGSRLAKCLDKLHKELRQHPLFERKNA
ncbi:MAG: RNA polymerase sigma factor [Pontiella sp.]